MTTPDNSGLEDQSEIIEFLSRSESYGVEQPVQRRETHAAIVFLDGPFAYKLKRAVRCMAGRRKLRKSKLWRSGRTPVFRSYGSTQISPQSPGGWRTEAETCQNAGIAVARQQRSYVTRPSGWPVLDVTDVNANACAAAAARMLNLPPYEAGSSVYV